MLELLSQFILMMNASKRTYSEQCLSRTLPSGSALAVRRRELVITSILDEDPRCVGVGGGYARHHLSDDCNEQNLLT